MNIKWPPMKSMRPLSLLTVLLAAVLMTPANSDPMKVEVKQFGGSVTIPKRASGVSYHWPLATEKFVVMTPADYDPNKSYGLLVDIGPSNSFSVPRSWGPVLAQKNMLLVAPLKVGNDQNPARRMGMAVLGAQAMKRDFNIDSHRVYVSGLSGGARTANVVAFYHPVFKEVLFWIYFGILFGLAPSVISFNRTFHLAFRSSLIR